VVLRRPAAHLQPGGLERPRHLVRKPRFDVDDAVRGMQARPPDGLLRVESLVEDPRRDLDERAA
jgi:hypothetical protein